MATSDPTPPTAADEVRRLRAVLERCLDYVGSDANRYGTASTAGPLLGSILRVLGRNQTADGYVLERRMKSPTGGWGEW